MKSEKKKEDISEGGVTFVRILRGERRYENATFGQSWERTRTTRYTLRDGSTRSRAIMLIRDVTTATRPHLRSPPSLPANKRYRGGALLFSLSLSLSLPSFHPLSPALIVTGFSGFQLLKKEEEAAAEEEEEEISVAFFFWFPLLSLSLSLSLFSLFFSNYSHYVKHEPWNLPTNEIHTEWWWWRRHRSSLYYKIFDRENRRKKKWHENAQTKTKSPRDLGGRS